MKSVNERLRVFFENYKLEQTEIAEKLNVSKQRVNNWLTATSIPMYAFSDIMLAFPTLNANWLFTGVGSMLLYGSTETPIFKSEDPISPYKCNNPACIKEIEMLHEQITDLRADKTFLKETVEDLRRKVGMPGEKHDQGGVEESRRTG